AGGSISFEAAACIYLRAYFGLCRYAGDDIDSTCKGIYTIDAGGRAAQYFNMVDRRQGNGNVRQVVAGLRVRHFYAIDEYQYLVESAAVDRHIALRTEGAALAKVNPCYVRKQFVYR